ncbi:MULTISPECIES: hypothetical protein [Bacillus]|uniref:N-acetylmuramoyl-L-alanine amidase family protein n=1 Tax=Bacillus TaxID=1386 RepID=UPI0007724F8E|nr:MULTISPECIES: hypothetical protein [Bacillus]KXH80344.1 hypothetical protein AU379_23960 [Bacillus sp. JH7]
MAVDLAAAQRFLTKEINKETIIKLTKNVGYEFYQDANKNEFDFNNTFRTMTMGVASLIPYGGMIISPVIGLIWPETPHEDKIEAQLTQLGKEINHTIIDYDKITLSQKFKYLKEKLVDFENKINPGFIRGHDVSAAYYTDVKNVRAIDALHIHQKFEELLAECSKDEGTVPENNQVITLKGLKTAELPIYTAVATLHLLFVRFMNLFGTDPKAGGFSQDALNEKFGDNKLKEYNKKYLDYIENTWKNRKLTSTNKLFGTQKPGDPLVGMTYQLFNTTWNSPALRVAADITAWKRDNKLNKEYTGWVRIGAKHYYLEYGKKKTGWFQDPNTKKWYYLSQEDKDKFLKGEMRTGWFQDPNTKKWYYFTEIGQYSQTFYDDGHLHNGMTGSDKYTEGEMLTKWVPISGRGDVSQVSDAWYYFNHPNGDMKTGLLDEGGHIYYFSQHQPNSPESDIIISRVKHEGPRHTYYKDIKLGNASEGRMVTGFVYVQEKKATYYFNAIDHIIDHSKFQRPKDYYGNILALGEAVTGWFQEEGKWYLGANDNYLGMSGKVFEKGQLISDDSFIYDGKTYHFDKNGVCTNP